MQERWCIVHSDVRPFCRVSLLLRPLLSTVSVFVNSVNTTCSAQKLGSWPAVYSSAAASFPADIPPTLLPTLHLSCLTSQLLGYAVGSPLSRGLTSTHAPEHSHSLHADPPLACHALCLSQASTASFWALGHRTGIAPFVPLV